MILGVGVDIVSNLRIEEAVQTFDAFLERIYTPEEIKYCYKRAKPFPSLAARFAAKEAMIKAIPSRETIPMTEIEVVVEDNGQPSIHPGKTLKEELDKAGATAIHLSISHEKTYSVAYVVIEKAS
ncbi:MAG TPA: holo-[acyl-carrier-protein] synthase [Nitrospirae bacterium]|nr:holo-[acyl-carrier-protein] synthase [Nitrospirota bacterium]